MGKFSACSTDYLCGIEHSGLFLAEPQMEADS